MSRRPWTLRRRLVIGIVALVAIIGFGIGAASVYGLNRYLEQDVDEQLTSALSRTLDRAPAGWDDGQPSSSEFVLAPGSPVGTVAAAVVDGAVADSLVLLVNGERRMTEAEVAPLLSAAGTREPQTVSLGGNLGDYRVLSVSTRSGAEFVVGFPLSTTQSIVSQFRNVIVLISALGVLIAALASAFLVTLALKPLRRVAATATQVASLPLDRGEVSLAVRVPEQDTDARTEVGQVGAAFNSMLGHVDEALRARQASENKVRQFVADASHELRTPLASIRGYAELTRRGGHNLPPDVTHSMGRVESEAVRMTSLVEDLLLLARLDEGRELEKRPVDLTALLVNCISDAYAAGPEHDWDLDAPDEPVVVPGDEQRIHQVIANLLTNARVHTPEGTAVDVALSRTAEGSAVITVTDNGPGIPEAQQASLFERFARGDSSRSRIAGSTGLGLSIVQAVTVAHGGTVAVSSEPGRTQFRIELPGAAIAPSSDPSTSAPRSANGQGSLAD
ncbi:MAG TPA: HAMP domain-containing sensor histidine kinase [Glaciihabitans sp.]|nr:HAMP domain-containing sensor histidine kinase [Glaciihabitans sp.]